MCSTYLTMLLAAAEAPTTCSAERRVNKCCADQGAAALAQAPFEHALRRRNHLQQITPRPAETSARASVAPSPGTCARSRSKSVRELAFQPPRLGRHAHTLASQPGCASMVWPEVRRSPANSYTAIILKNTGVRWRELRDPSDEAARTLFSRYEGNLALDHFCLHITGI